MGKSRWGQLEVEESRRYAEIQQLVRAVLGGSFVPVTRDQSGPAAGSHPYLEPLTAGVRHP